MFVGAGPAGLAPLVWAARTGLLPELAVRGLAVVEPEADPGAGRIGDYAIHSDTAAATFLECLADGAAPRLAALRDRPSARRIAAFGNDAVPLADVASFLRDLGRAMLDTLTDHGVPVIAARAIGSRRSASGWETIVDGPQGRQRLRSRSLILATGAIQGDESLDGVRIGKVALRDLGHRTMLSGEVLGRDGLAAMKARLTKADRPTVAIVGGSHSALAAAWRVLNEVPEARLGKASVTVLHRRPLRPFYATPQAAHDDGFVDFDGDDICPVSGRLFRLAGFRFRARDLVRQGLGIGDARTDPRLEFLPLEPHNIAEAERRLRAADVVIAALGYRPQALPLYDQTGQKIALAPDRDRRAALVDDACRVLDVSGSAVPNVYALGLAAGFRPSGALGGEPSFSGQTNGLWLWQNGVGERIVRRLLSDV